MTMPEPIAFRIRADGPQAAQLRRLAETLGITEADAMHRCIEHGLRSLTRAVEKVNQKRRR